MFTGQETHMVRESTLFTLVYFINAIPIRNPSGFFGKKKNTILKSIGKYKLILMTDKLIQKFIWNRPGSRITKTILRKNKVREWTLPGFKTYPKAIVSTIAYYRYKDKQK